MAVIDVLNWCIFRLAHFTPSSSVKLYLSAQLETVCAMCHKNFTITPCCVLQSSRALWYWVAHRLCGSMNSHWSVSSERDIALIIQTHTHPRNRPTGYTHTYKRDVGKDELPELHLGVPFISGIKLPHERLSMIFPSFTVVLAYCLYRIPEAFNHVRALGWMFYVHLLPEKRKLYSKFYQADSLIFDAKQRRE